MSEIKFSCPHCDQRLACDDTAAGTLISCPVCNRRLVVPSSTELAVPPTARLLSGPTRSMAPPPLPLPRSPESPGGAWIAFVGGLLCLMLFMGSCRTLGKLGPAGLLQNPLSLVGLLVIGLLYFAGYRIAAGHTERPWSRLLLALAYVFVIQAVVAVVLFAVLFAGCAFLMRGQ